MNFDVVAGTEHTKESLSSAAASGKFPHAIVLQGDRGTGKRTLAKWLAQALVCRQPNAPCGVCASCIRAKAGSHPDIRVEEGSGATRSLTVNTIKDIIADAYKMPEEADVQVYLLFIENKIGEAAQNKLLKLIEEPPARTAFIFTCQSAEVLLPTIRSRTQIFTLKAPAPQQAADFLAEHRGVPREKASALAELCGGNIGQMLEELESGNAAAVRHIADEVLQKLTARAEQEIFAVTAPLIKDRKLFADVLEQLYALLRQAVLVKNGCAGLVQPEKQPLQRLTAKKLMTLMELTGEYRRKIENNANMALLVTSFCAQARKAAGR